MVCFACSDTENLVDAQVPFVPSVEVMVKTLIIMSSATLAAAPSACLQVVFCSHHPCIGTAKRNSVWRVMYYSCLFCMSWIQLLLRFDFSLTSKTR